VAPKTGLGKALSYLLEHWVGLTRYLEDGRLEICERKVRMARPPAGRQRMPEHFLRCATRVLHAASTMPEPMGSLRALACA